MTTCGKVPADTIDLEGFRERVIEVDALPPIEPPHADEAGG